MLNLSATPELSKLYFVKIDSGMISKSETSEKCDQFVPLMNTPIIKKIKVPPFSPTISGNYEEMLSCWACYNWSVRVV